MEPIFFSSWSTLGRTFLLGVSAYATMVLLLRVTGKRTLSKFNMFDFVVTIALGSILASLMLSKTTTLAQGIVAFGTLILMQLAATYLSVRSRFIERLMKAEPALLAFDGEPIERALRRERVTMAELDAAAREAGLGALERTKAMVLETDGTITVVGQGDYAGGDAVPEKIRRNSPSSGADAP